LTFSKVLALIIRFFDVLKVLSSKRHFLLTVRNFQARLFVF